MYRTEAPETWRGEVMVIGYSNKALRLQYEGEEAWIPFSQIHPDSEIYSASQFGETGELVIPQWLAERKKWI